MSSQVADRDGFGHWVNENTSELSCPCGGWFEWEGYSEDLEPWREKHRPHLPPAAPPPAPAPPAPLHHLRCHSLEQDYACTCGVVAPTTPEEVADVVAFHWQLYRETVVEALRGVPDALLHQTAEQLHQLEKQEEGPPVLGMFAYLLEVEVDTRRVFARAREVGADTYCVYHDGDLKDCAAEHFDGEDA